jgi:hypothetical protein
MVRANFGQRVIEDRQVEAGHLVEPAPAAGYESGPLLDVGGIEAPLVKIAIDENRLEVIGHDELGKDRIAADVPLAHRVERFRIDHSDHIPQIEIAVGDPLDITAADVTQITFFALGHRGSAERQL